MESYTDKTTGMEVVNLGPAGWQDEDGVAITPSKNSTVAADDAKKLADAKSIRTAATKKGLKALKGSAAQKKWAEKIRKDVLPHFRADELELLADNDALLSAKFWIDGMQSAKKRGGQFWAQSLHFAIVAKL